jgi:hypothetical protein
MESQRTRGDGAVVLESSCIEILAIDEHRSGLTGHADFVIPPGQHASIARHSKRMWTMSRRMKKRRLRQPKQQENEDEKKGALFIDCGFTCCSAVGWPFS